MSEICDVFCINKEAVEDVRAKMLDHQLVADAVEIFKVLGDPTRMRLLHALAQRELCVCDLSAVLGHDAICDFSPAARPEKRTVGPIS